MPNWVKNKVCFSGNEKDIERLKNYVKSEESAFDFNNIIPMPNELNVTSGSDEQTAISCARARREGKTTCEDFEKDWVRNRMSFDEWADIGENYLHNFEKYGSTTWYGWCCDHWGTKWNASEPYWSDDMVTFETAWSAPYPIYEELAKKFPGVDIDVDYADEDLGSNCGQITCRDGMCVCDEPEDPFVFACDIWDYDPDEMKEEYEGV